MDTRYYLMRKNEVITLMQFGDTGKLEAYSNNISESAREIAPLAYRCHPNEWLYKWWADRSIPLSRDQIEEFLRSRGLPTPGLYLIKNLGLSLTDYYWIKPVDSDLTWEKVNLFENDFHDNILLPDNSREQDAGTCGYSPNGSLQGNIEKTWTIINGKRCMIKGNHSGLSCESLNEVIAANIHKKQGYDNYTDYSLIHIKGKSYKYGCLSEMFTSAKKELVSAWAVCSSEKKKRNISDYEHFINVCKMNGIDEVQLRRDLEYQIMTDYVLTGYDRHLNNISVLRDADTLKFIRMAPIYDSGDCLFANRELPRNMKELQKMEITSFAKHEDKLLNLVTDKGVLDVNKLPDPEYIREIYHKDDKISDSYIEKMVFWYEKKKDML